MKTYLVAVVATISALVTYALDLANLTIVCGLIAVIALIADATQTIRREGFKVRQMTVGELAQHDQISPLGLNPSNLSRFTPDDD